MKEMKRNMENMSELRKIVKGIERGSFRALIIESNSLKSEGKLAKEINFSDFE